MKVISLSMQSKTDVQSGLIAGSVSALIFLIVHDLTISNIWFSAPLALAAGALCGLCMSWSFSLLVGRYSTRNWLQYNFLYLMMIILFGVVSILILEPVATMAELSAMDGPPHELIAKALPLTALYTLIAAAVISLFYPRSRRNFGAVLVTTFLLVILLGLNVSILGFVVIPLSAIMLVFKFFALIVLLNAVYVLVFMLLQIWRQK